MVKTPKFHLNAHKHLTKSLKFTFWIALVKTFRMICNLTGFVGRPHFSIVFSDDIIMTSFLVTWLSNLHILSNLPKTIRLQSFNALSCVGQLSQKDWENK